LYKFSTTNHALKMQNSHHVLRFFDVLLIVYHLNWGTLQPNNVVMSLFDKGVVISLFDKSSI